LRRSPYCNRIAPLQPIDSQKSVSRRWCRHVHSWVIPGHQCTSNCCWCTQTSNCLPVRRCCAPYTSGSSPLYTLENVDVCNPSSAIPHDHIPLCHRKCGLAPYPLPPIPQDPHPPYAPENVDLHPAPYTPGSPPPYIHQKMWTCARPLYPRIPTTTIQQKMWTYTPPQRHT